MKALLLRILKQLKNDPRTLALMLVAPFLIMSLIYLLLGDSDYRPVVATYNMPSSFTEPLTTSAEVKTLPSRIHGSKATPPMRSFGRRGIPSAFVY